MGLGIIAVSARVSHSHAGLSLEACVRAHVVSGCEKAFL